MTLLEEIIKETIKPILSDTYSLLKGEAQHYFSNRLLEYEIYLYKSCYYQKTLLHRFEAVPVDIFYVPQHLRPYTGYGHSSTSDMDSFYNAFKGSNAAKERFPATEIQDVIKFGGDDDNGAATNTASNIIIFGNAGSGKSTLVRHLVISSIRQHFKTPIYVELRTIGGDLTFEKYIFENIFYYQKLGVNDEVIDRILDRGNFLFILDGFDEIQSAFKSKVSQEIKDFVQKYENNKRDDNNIFIITSRYYESLTSFQNFKNYEICEFSDSEAEQFILKQFSEGESEKASLLIKELSETKNLNTKEFLKNPLLLSLFIITYLTHPEITFSKSEFYYNVFDALFYRLDRFLKADYVHEKITKLSKEEFIRILSQFSFITYFKNKYEFTDQYFDEVIQMIKELKSYKFNIQEFKVDISTNINIIIRDGELFRFPHRTLQEYFCAYFINQITELQQKKLVYDYIVDHGDENYFLVSLLIEIDFVNTLEYIIIPLIRKWVDRFVISRSRSGYQSEKGNYIMYILDSNPELSALLKEFLKPYLESNGYDQAMAPPSVRERYFAEHGITLVTVIYKYINKLRNQDSKIIELLSPGR